VSGAGAESSVSTIPLPVPFDRLRAGSARKRVLMRSDGDTPMPPVERLSLFELVV
jgi:hypothetical protein